MCVLGGGGGGGINRSNFVMQSSFHSCIHTVEQRMAGQTAPIISTTTGLIINKQSSDDEIHWDDNDDLQLTGITDILCDEAVVRDLGQPMVEETNDWSYKTSSNVDQDEKEQNIFDVAHPKVDDTIRYTFKDIKMSVSTDQAYQLLNNTLSSDNTKNEVKQENMTCSQPVFGLTGPTGVGKTNLLIDLIVKGSCKSIIYVVGKKLLVKEIVHRIREHGQAIPTLQVVDYAAFLKRPDGAKYRPAAKTIYVTTVTSLFMLNDAVKRFHKPVDRFDLAVIDEYNCTMITITKESLVKESRHKSKYEPQTYNKMSVADIQSKTIEILRQARVIICAESMYGEYTSRSIDCLANGREVQEIQLRSAFDDKMGSPFRKIVIMDKYELNKTVHDYLYQYNANIAYAYPFKDHLIRMQQLVDCTPTSDKKWLRTYSFMGCSSKEDEDDMEVNNVRAVAHKCNALLYSPSICCGHSIDVPNHFTAVFGTITSSINAAVPELIDQIHMLGRVRRSVEQQLFLTLTRTDKRNASTKSLDQQKQEDYITTQSIDVLKELAVGTTTINDTVFHLLKADAAELIARLVARTMGVDRDQIVFHDDKTIHAIESRVPSFANTAADKEAERMNLEIHQTDMTLMSKCQEDARRHVVSVYENTPPRRKYLTGKEVDRLNEFLTPNIPVRQCRPLPSDVDGGSFYYTQGHIAKDIVLSKIEQKRRMHRHYKGQAKKIKFT